MVENGTVDRQRNSLWRIAAQLVLGATVVVAGFGLPVINPETAPVAVAAPGQACPDVQERAFIRRLNGYRQQRGLMPLVVDTGLMRAAHHHSVDISKMSAVTGHILRDGTGSKQNMANFGYPVGQARTGENLAFGSTWNTGAEAFNTWLNSPTHSKKLKRGSFRAIGIARVYAPNSRYGWYWTATFGSIIDERPKC